MSQAQVAGLVVFGFCVVGAIAIYAILAITQKPSKKTRPH